MYYRQQIIITQLTIRFSSVHVAHTCGFAGVALDWSVRDLNEKQSQDDKERLYGTHGLLHTS